MISSHLQSIAKCRAKTTAPITAVAAWIFSTVGGKGCTVAPALLIEIQVFLKIAFDDKVCGAYTISNCSKAFSAACSSFAILTAMARDPFKGLLPSGKTGPLGPLPAVAFKTGWTSKSPTVPLCPLPPWSAIPSSERSEWLAFSLNFLTPAGSNAQTMAQSCTNYGISRGALVDRDQACSHPEHSTLNFTRECFVFHNFKSQQRAEPSKSRFIRSLFSIAAFVSCLRYLSSISDLQRSSAFIIKRHVSGKSAVSLTT